MQHCRAETSPKFSTSTGTVRVKIITGSLVIPENLYPQNYRYRYHLEIRMNSFNYHYRYRLGVRSHTSIPLIPNNNYYHFENHLNLFPQNYRYRYRLEMFLNEKGNAFEYDGTIFWEFSDIF